MEENPAKRYVVLSIAATLKSMRVRYTCCIAIMLMSQTRARAPDDDHNDNVHKQRADLNTRVSLVLQTCQTALMAISSR